MKSRVSQATVAVAAVLMLLAATGPARAEGNSYQNLGLFTNSTEITVANGVLEGSEKWAYTGSSPVEIVHSHLIGIEADGAGLSCLAVTWNGAFYESSCP